MLTENRSHKIAIKDLAKMCNVSTQTISRVINNSPDVSPETRKLVESKIAETGYQPSALARSLVQQRTHTIGIITSGMNYTGVSRTLNGIVEQSEAAGYTVIIKQLPNFSSFNIVPVIQSLIAHRVEGIIFAAPDVNESIALAQSRLPSFCPPIVFLKSRKNSFYPTISIDNVGGARQAVDHLLSLGRKNIGLISGPLEWLEARQRKQGWETALKAAGQRVSDQNWVQGNWSSMSGQTVFAELLQKYPEMDAVFASNDQMALGVLHYANAHGICVPDDFAIVGFDDTAEAEFFSPSLTTIRHPLYEMGTLAVKTLLARIVNETEQKDFSLILQTELVVRRSSLAV